MTVRLIKHEDEILGSGSYEVRDGDDRHFFYFDGHAGRRAINRKLEPGVAEERAKALARKLRDSKPPG